MKGKLYFEFIKYKKIKPKNIIKLFNIYKISNESKFIIKEKDPPKIWENVVEFENYFENSNGEGFLLKNEKSQKTIKLRNNEKIIFNGCYDYDSKNEIFILTKDESMH